MWSSLLVLVTALPILTSQQSADSAGRVAPTIITGPPSVVVFPALQQGHVPDLRCDALGSPPPAVRWRRRDGEPIAESYLQPDGVLRLPADVSSDGFYQCLAENDAGTAMSNFTAVRAVEMPADDENKRLTVTAGDAVMLHCPLYRASVPVDISWLYEDSYHDYVPVDVNQTNKAMSDNGSLVITWAEVADSKTYKCRAAFALSTRSHYSRQYQLVVNERSDRPTFSVRWLAGTTSVTSLEGDDVTLSCIFSGRVERIVWERADKRPMRGSSSSLWDFDRRLTLRGVGRSDCGHYMCTAHYELLVDASHSDEPSTTKHAHQTSVTVELRVRGAKPRLVRPLISLNISESERDTALTFHCEPVTSSSSSSSAGEQQSLTSITWYINAEPLTHDEDWWQMSSDRRQLTIVRPRSCVVSCNISNEHGYLLSSARLTVLPPGYVETPEVTDAVTQSSNQPPADDVEESWSHVMIVVIISLLVSSTLVCAAVAVAAVLYSWKRHRQMQRNAKKEDKAAAATDGQLEAREERAATDDDDAEDDDKSQSSLDSSHFSASQDSGINFTTAQDDADAAVANPTSDDDDVEIASLLDRDDVSARPTSAS